MDEEPLVTPLGRSIRAAHDAVAAIDVDAAARLAALLEKVGDRRFDVAVLGEFKRGKSTFVNALLGAPVLPAGVLPVTSVVTEIGYADEPRLSVQLVDRSLETDPGRIAEFVTEDANPGNRLGVRRVQLGYPASFLRGGISLYDTPGVGSVHDANTEATVELLPTVDAAFFLTSADPPISASERAFLDRVADHADKLFFVVNKLDVVSHDDRRRVLGFTAEVLRDSIGRDAQPFGVSARAALEGRDDGMDALVDAFSRFLREGRASTTARSAARKATNEVERVLDVVLVEDAALDLTADDVAERRRTIAEIAERTERERRTLEVVLHRDLEDVVAQIEQDLRALHRAEVVRLLAEARTIAASWRELQVEPSVLDARIKELLRADVNAWLVAEQRKVAGLVHAATARFSAAAAVEGQRAVAACSDVVDLQLGEVPGFEDLAPARRFSFSMYEPPALLASLAPDVRARLSRQISARLSLKTAEARIPSLVDKHCGRLRYHLTQQLADTERSLVRAYGAYLTSFIEALDGALARAHEIGSAELEGIAERRRALREAAADLKAAVSLLGNAVEPSPYREAS